jgi:hypothetical protein
VNRTVKQTPSEIEGEYKWEVTITSDPCETRSFPVLRNLLRTCIETHGMLACGVNVPSNIKIYHDNMSWVVVMEAVGP